MRFLFSLILLSILIFSLSCKTTTQDQSSQSSSEIQQEELQEKSDKIMKEVEDNMKNFDLSKSESNENSKVDMSGNKEDK